jgi:hypothetical protein
MSNQADQDDEAAAATGTTAATAATHPDFSSLSRDAATAGIIARLRADLERQTLAADAMRTELLVRPGGTSYFFPKFMLNSLNSAYYARIMPDYSEKVPRKCSQIAQLCSQMPGMLQVMPAYCAWP